MEKKSGTSWLKVMKRVFRSPTKDDDNGKKSCRRRDGNHEQEDEEKKREKRRWLFRKPVVQHCEAKTNTSDHDDDDDPIETTAINPVLAAAEQRHAIAVAAASEAAAATAQPAVKIVRLTRPSSFIREHNAATVIQTAFRGYLARRALRALKGLVKLQALVRGQNVRKQAKVTLKCMQALVRVQDQVRHQRARLSLEGSRNSMLAEINSLWGSTCLQDIRHRLSLSRELSTRGTEYDWDDCPQTGEDVESKLQSRKEASLKREKALAYAFSHQIWKTRRNPSAGNEEELEERTKWLERWMATKQRENTTERRDSNIRTVEIDTSSRPHSSSYSAPNVVRRPQQSPSGPTTGPYVGPKIASSTSPQHRAQYSLSHLNCQCYSSSPVTPSPSKSKSLKLKVRSASPRCPKEERERCYSAAHTPSLGNGSATCRFGLASFSSVPNYMAATESAKARARPQSAPRQSRPPTPERDQRGGSGSAKKRLYYPVLEPQNDVVGVGGSSFSQYLRSPSFKSLQNGFYGLENLSSCYTESVVGGRDVSPCSTTDLRWLK